MATMQRRSALSALPGKYKQKHALDHEKDDAYSVTVSVSDGNNGSDSITVTINVTNVNEAPSFPSTKITLSVAENVAIGTAIGNPFQATDPEGDTLTYSLRRSDRAAFSIDANTGQLKTDTLLDYETKNAYNDLAVRATDPDGQFDAILVTISVTDANDAPVFTDGDSATRAIAREHRSQYKHRCCRRGNRFQITIRSPIHSAAQMLQRSVLLAHRDNSKPAMR